MRNLEIDPLGYPPRTVTPPNFGSRTLPYPRGIAMLTGYPHVLRVPGYPKIFRRMYVLVSVARRVEIRVERHAYLVLLFDAATNSTKRYVYTFFDSILKRLDAAFWCTIPLRRYIYIGLDVR